MLYRYVCSEFTYNSLGSGVFWYIIILYIISYIKFLGIVMHLHLVGSQNCVRKYTKKSPMSNDGSRKAMFLNRQMKSNFSRIIYIKWIKYYVISTTAIKTARMCHTELWQSTYVEMQNIVHHDKVTDALELDPSKKMQNTTLPLWMYSSLQENAWDFTSNFPSLSNNTITCLYFFFLNVLELRTFPSQHSTFTTLPLFDINWCNWKHIMQPKNLLTKC